jgi:hypothetical protein
MTERPSDLPEHEQQAWEAIVADLSGQIDLGPQFPKERSLPALSADGDHPDPLAEPPELDDDEEVGYQPPHPPPLPRPRDATARFAWAAVIGGPTLVLVVNALGWEGWLSGVGVVATVAGFAALVARMKDEREDDGDNGAVV